MDVFLNYQESSIRISLTKSSLEGNNLYPAVLKKKKDRQPVHFFKGQLVRIQSQ